MFKKILGIAALVALAGMATGAWAQPALDAEQVLGKVAQYKFGEDRTALDNLVSLLSQAKPDAEKTKTLETRLIAMLDGDATVDAKNFICRELMVYGGAASVPALVKALGNPDIATSAVWALENIPAKEAADALANAAVSTQGPLRVGLTQALGRRGIVKPLETLVVDADPAVAEAAANALARIASPDACAIVAAKRGAATGPQRLALDRAYLECADALAQQGKKDAALKMYDELVAPGNAEHVRSGALGGLVKAKPAEALSRVQAALGDADPAFAAVSLAFVRQLPGAEATRAFAARLANLDAEGQVRLVRALQARGDAAAEPEVTKLAESTNEDVQAAALDALGVLGGTQNVAKLCDVAAHGAAKTSRAARASLDRLPGANTDTALLAAAREGAVELRVEAIGALGRRDASGSVSAVMALAKDPEAAVRAEALKALSTLAADQQLPALLDLLEKGANKEDRPAIQTTIAAIVSRSAAKDAQAKTVLARLAKSKDAEARIVMLQLAGQLTTDATFAVLKTALTDADANMRAEAIKLLGQWPDGAGIAELRGVFDQPKDAAEGALVFDALVQALKGAATLPAADRAELYRALLTKAQDDAQVKSVISGLADLPCIQSLNMVQELLQAGKFPSETQLATLKISTVIANAYPDEVQKAIAPLTQEGTEPNLKKKADAVAAQLAAPKDFISAWEMSGPYFKEGKPAHLLFGDTFLPETSPAKAAWRIVPMSAKPDSNWSVDLAELIGGSDRVVYLRTRVQSPQAQDAVLALGSNDDVKAWLNGKQVFAFNDARGLMRDNDRVIVHLEQGCNTLLLGVYQRSGGWGACARFLDKDGQPLQGLTCGVEAVK